MSACYIVSCHKHYYPIAYTSKTYAIDTARVADSTYVKMLQPYRQRMEQQMQVVIGFTDTLLTKGRPEGALGNFTADAMLQEAKRINPSVAIAVANSGGIRISQLAPGNITLGKVYEWMPYDNALVIVNIPGNVLQQFCSHMAMNGGWPVSGLSYKIKDKQAIDIKVGGLPLKEDQVYIVATNDYLLYGGDNCSFLTSLKNETTNRFIREILIDEIKNLAKQNKPVHAYIEKRVSYAE